MVAERSESESRRDRSAVLSAGIRGGLSLGGRTGRPHETQKPLPGRSGFPQAPQNLAAPPMAPLRIGSTMSGADGSAEEAAGSVRRSDQTGVEKNVARNGTA